MSVTEIADTVRCLARYPVRSILALASIAIVIGVGSADSTPQKPWGVYLEPGSRPHPAASTRADSERVRSAFELAEDLAFVWSEQAAAARSGANEMANR
jgi:hypothetical protein